MRRPRQPKWKETTVRRTAEQSLSRSRNRPGCHSAQQRSLTGQEEISSAASSPRAKCPHHPNAERPWTGSRSPSTGPLPPTMAAQGVARRQIGVPIRPVKRSGRSRHSPSWPKRPSPSCRGIGALVPSRNQDICPSNRLSCDSSTNRPMPHFSRPNPRLQSCSSKTTARRASSTSAAVKEPCVP